MHPGLGLWAAAGKQPVHGPGGDPGVVVAAHIALVAARSDWLRSRNREAKAGRDANSSSATLGRGNMLPKNRKRYRIIKAENGWKMKNLEHFFS